MLTTHYLEEADALAEVLAEPRFAEAGDFDTALAMLRFENGAMGVVETARHGPWGYDIRTEVAGARGKVVIEDVQKTAATFSHDFCFHGDHFENFPDRFAVAFRLDLAHLERDEAAQRILVVAQRLTDQAPTGAGRLTTERLDRHLQPIDEPPADRDQSGLEIAVGQRRHGGTQVGILGCLFRHRGRAVSRAELLEKIWGAPGDLETRTVDMTISNLRQKIETDPAHPAIVVTVKGVGYAWGEKR